MAEIELSAGTIEYEDTGGEGPPVVLLHGLVMNGSLWRNVVPKLSPEHRCIVPTLPLGGHRLPMRPDADLSMGGQAALVAELLERLDLRDVTLVMSDWGGALLYASGDGQRSPRPARARLVRGLRQRPARPAGPRGLAGGEGPGRHQRGAPAAAPAAVAAPPDRLRLDGEAPDSGRRHGRLAAAGPVRAGRSAATSPSTRAARPRRRPALSPPPSVCGASTGRRSWFGPARIG